MAKDLKSLDFAEWTSAGKGKGVPQKIRLGTYTISLSQGALEDGDGWYLAGSALSDGGTLGDLAQSLGSAFDVDLQAAVPHALGAVPLSNIGLRYTSAPRVMEVGASFKTAQGSLADLGGTEDNHGISGALAPLLDCKLDSLGVRYDLDVHAITMTASLSWPHVPLVPGVIAIENARADLEVGTYGVSGDLNADLRLGAVDWSVSAFVPSMRGELAMQTGQSYHVGPVLDALHIHAPEFAHLTVHDSKLLFDASAHSFAAHVELDDVLDLGNFKLSSLKLDVSYASGNAGEPATYSASGLAGLEVGPDISLDLLAEMDTSGWSFSGGIRRPIDLVKFARDLGVTLPTVIEDATAKALSVRYQSANSALDASLETGLKIAGAPELDLRAHLKTSTPPGAASNVSVTGALTIGELVFDAGFGSGADATTVVASYSDPGGGAASLSSLLKAFGADALEGVTFELKDALVSYTSGDPGGGFLIAADLDAGLDLSALKSLPLVGKLVPKDQTLKVGLQPVYASNPAPPAPPKGLVPKGSPALPANIKPGFGLTAAITIGGETERLELGTAANPAPTGSEVQVAAMGRKPEGDSGEATKTASDTPASGAVAKADDVTWIDIQRSFGPLHFGRLGVGLQEGAIEALVDGSVQLGPLTVALAGLGASYNIESHDVSVELNGLGLEFQQGPLEISGAFLRFKDDYAGKVTVRAESFSLGGLGAYGSFEGHPSLFLYAFLDMPLGGPAFFFVEGLAAGFGLNRSLIVPGIDGVADFPLVAEVMGGTATKPATSGGQTEMDSLTGELAKLESAIRPQVGQYFLAAGVKFNSFKQIDSFAMVALSFGRRFELDVLGLSTLKMPTGAEKPLVEMDLALMARFAPAEGVLAIQAQLAQTSYLFTPECRLTGGFAFYLWFDGEHAGDFVITIGGYHPDFRVPSYYPRVPRLGINWQIDHSTKLVAEGYFALTSTAIMAGGSLSLTYRSGAVKAWLKLGADFLIEWKPVHYEGHFYIDIGVEATIHFFGTHHLRLELGADVQVWGPDFSGKAKLHIWILSVTVHFGPGGDKRPRLSWNAFCEDFLPAADKVLSLAATRGLVKLIQAPGKPDHPVLNARDLTITLTSAVPFTSHPDTDAHCKASNGTAPGLHVKPCGTDLASRATIKVARTGGGLEDKSFAVTPVYKRAPEALWTQQSETPEKVVSGYNLTPAVPPKPGKSLWVRDADLQFDGEYRALPETADNRKIGVKMARNGKAPQRMTPGDLAGPDPDMLAALGFDAADDVRMSSRLVDAFVVPPMRATSRGRN